VLEDFPGLCFEAHSTDYQDAGVFAELARRHFAILKVGPALTFAYRRAVYALDLIAGWYNDDQSRQALPQTMEKLMLANPGNWRKHYSGSAGEIRRLRHFGYADRIRYYWNQPEAQAAVGALMALLERRKPDRPLVEQYFAPETIERAGGLRENSRNWAHAQILAQIQDTLQPYFQAGG
jgi:D-tagatose-1,6-bisphosphate aldolase subunit GatZ/KbaZ